MHSTWSKLDKTNKIPLRKFLRNLANIEGVQDASVNTSLGLWTPEWWATDIITDTMPHFHCWMWNPRSTRRGYLFRHTGNLLVPTWWLIVQVMFPTMTQTMYTHVNKCKKNKRERESFLSPLSRRKTTVFYYLGEKPSPHLSLHVCFQGCLPPPLSKTKLILPFVSFTFSEPFPLIIPSCLLPSQQYRWSFPPGLSFTDSYLSSYLMWQANSGLERWLGFVRDFGS
jgi:hypothetical protein